MVEVSDFDYSGELMGDYLRGATIYPNIILLICASALIRILRLTSQGARRRQEQPDKSLFHIVLGARKSRPLQCGVVVRANYIIFWSDVEKHP